MKSATAIIWYYDPSIIRCVKSLKTDLIFIIDGKFPWYESNENLSPEQLREELRQIPNVVLIDCVADEPTKRTRYL